MNIITQMMNAGTNVQLVINVTDLKELFFQWQEEYIDEKKKPESNVIPETYLTQDEVSEKLQVDKSTLWRWDKNGYLIKCRVGGKVRYRLSDVTKLMEG